MPRKNARTEYQTAYVLKHYSTGSTKAIAELIGKTERQVQQIAFDLGVKKSKGAKGRATDKWRVLDEIIALIYEDMQNHEICEFLGIKRQDLISRACMMGLKKSKKALVELSRERAKNLTPKHQFQQGLVPWNKGMKGFDPVLGRGLYRPGNRSPNEVPVGTLRIRKPGKRDSDGGRSYLERKISDSPNTWKRVHRIVWETAHGPVPDGHIVVFKPGLHTVKEQEITLDRLECITRVELAHRNHPMNHSPELAGLYQLKSAISRQLNRITKEQKT